MAELMAEDPAAFRNFTRIGPDMFHELLQVVGPRITKNHTWFRQSINPDLKLAITLRFLATGDSYRTLMYWFRVAHNMICSIVRDTDELYNSQPCSCSLSGVKGNSVADWLKLH